jgi:hypothetical protein
MTSLQIHRRKSIRLKNFDYSTSGLYFVTICTHNKVSLFGAVRGARVELSRAGRVVQETWNALPSRFPSVGLDEFVIMPNHVHGILVFNRAPNPEGAASRAPTNSKPDLGQVTGAPVCKSFRPSSYVFTRPQVLYAQQLHKTGGGLSMNYLPDSSLLSFSVGQTFLSLRIPPLLAQRQGRAPSQVAFIHDQLEEMKAHRLRHLAARAWSPHECLRNSSGQNNRDSCRVCPQQAALGRKFERDSKGGSE